MIIIKILTILAILKYGSKELSHSIPTFFHLISKMNNSSMIQNNVILSKIE